MPSNNNYGFDENGVFEGCSCESCTQERRRVVAMEEEIAAAEDAPPPDDYRPEMVTPRPVFSWDGGGVDGAGRFRAYLPIYVPASVRRSMVQSLNRGMSIHGAVRDAAAGAEIWEGMPDCRNYPRQGFDGAEIIGDETDASGRTYRQGTNIETGGAIHSAWIYDARGIYTDVALWEIIEVCIGCYTSAGDDEAGRLDAIMRHRRTRGSNRETWCAMCEFCVAHCSCWQCQVAGGGEHDVEGYMRPCVRCGRCSSHCSCWQCPQCETWRDNQLHVMPDCPASACTICTECTGAGASCGHVPSMSWGRPRLTYGVRFHDTAGVRGRLMSAPAPRRFASFELEIASAERTQAIMDIAAKYRCSIVGDGSLPDSGFEIRMAPARAGAFINLYADMSDALRRGGAKINQQCGAHVHFDARDLSLFDLRRWTLAWAITERAWFATQSEKRQQNTYCAPSSGIARSLLKMNGRLPEYIDAAGGNGAQALKHLTIDALGYGNNNYSPMQWKRAQKKRLHNSFSINGGRYRAFNLCSYFKHKTVEIRLHSGIKTADAAIGWAQSLDALWNFAGGVSENWLVRELQIQDKAIRNGDGAAVTERQKDILTKACTDARISNKYLLKRWARYGVCYLY